MQKPPPPPRPRRVGVEPCEVEGCDKLISARGWCSAHYTRWQRRGSPTARLAGEVVDGKRICPACKKDVPLADWYIQPSTGRAMRCRECFGEQNRAKAHLRRVSKEGDYFTRADVLDRDGWVCGVCGTAIDSDLKHPHPMSVSLDHVVPLARGGKHVIENCQPAHLVCNSRKNAKLLPKKKGGPSWLSGQYAIC